MGSNKMGNHNISTKGLIQIILIFGVIYLASTGSDAWGWLLFVFFLTIWD
jgi:hypothetical protein